LGLESKGLENFILTQERLMEQERPFEKIILVKDKENLIEKATYKIFHDDEYKFYNPTRFLNAIEEVQPDIIHAHFGPMGVTLHNLLSEYNLDIPLVISFHGTDIISMPKTDAKYAFELRKLNNYPYISFTANSNFLKNRLIESGIDKERIKVIYNTFNPLFCGFKKTQYFEYGNELKIINIARLINWKGQKYLIEGFAKFLKNTYPKAKLTLIGSGEDMVKLNKLAKKLGIENNVQFLGFVEDLEIPIILKDHDVYIQPSIRDENTFQEEAFGIAILEAIAIGLPVVVTNTGGMPEVIMENNGQYSFLIPEKDSDAIYETLKKMIDGNYKFQNNEEYSRKVLCKYSYDNHINNLIQIYEEMIQNEELT
jgi:glycosyltransferase involved in cell wall biosynthesis